MASVVSILCKRMPISVVDCPVLEYISAIGVTATFVRETEENALPQRICILGCVFAFLPSFLVTVKPNLRIYRYFSIFRGISVGLVTGCASFIVDVQDSTGHPFYSGPGAVNGPFYLKLAFCLETLHVFMLIACLLWTIVHLCHQNSCFGRIPLAAGGAICGELILLSMSALRRTSAEYLEGRILLTIFVIMFLVAMIPCMPSEQRAVILAWLAVFISFLWQTCKWDKTVWSWNTLRFPVPGGLTAHMLVMMSSTPRVSSKDFSTYVATKIASSAYETKQEQWKSQIRAVLTQSYRLYMKYIYELESVFAFVAAFCYFRIAPFLVVYPFYPQDRALSCIFIIVTLATLHLLHLERYFSSSTLTMFSLCQILFYVVWTFSSRHPVNCYAVDTLLGISLLNATKKAIAQSKVSVKVAENGHYLPT